jgi:hypothetical protein
LIRVRKQILKIMEITAAPHNLAVKSIYTSLPLLLSLISITLYTITTKNNILRMMGALLYTYNSRLNVYITMTTNNMALSV